MLPCILKRLCIFKNVQLYYQKGVIRKGYTFFCCVHVLSTLQHRLLAPSNIVCLSVVTISLLYILLIYNDLKRIIYTICYLCCK